jgi:hypothetical protein
MLQMPFRRKVRTGRSGTKEMFSLSVALLL